MDAGPQKALKMCKGSKQFADVRELTSRDAFIAIANRGTVDSTGTPTVKHNSVRFGSVLWCLFVGQIFELRLNTHSLSWHSVRLDYLLPQP